MTDLVGGTSVHSHQTLQEAMDTDPQWVAWVMKQPEGVTARWGHEMKSTQACYLSNLYLTPTGELYYQQHVTHVHMEQNRMGTAPGTPQLQLTSQVNPSDPERVIHAVGLLLTIDPVQLEEGAAQLMAMQTVQASALNEKSVQLLELIYRVRQNM
jgi:hypothetical protein